MPRFRDIESSETFQSYSPEDQDMVRDAYRDEYGYQDEWDDITNSETFTGMSTEDQDLVSEAFDDEYGVELGGDYRSSRARPDDEVEDEGYGFSDFGRDVKDVGVSFMKGAAALPKVAGQVFDFLGADTLGDKLKDVGTEGEEYWEKDYSDKAREIQGQTFLSKEEGKVFGENPVRKVLFSAAESAPGMFATGLVGAPLGAGLKLAKFAPKLTKAIQGMGVSSTRAEKLAGYAEGVAAYGTAESLYSGLQNAAEAGERVEKITHEELTKSPVYLELLSKHNNNKEEAKKELRDNIEKATVIKTGAGTFLGSFAGGGGILAKIAAGKGKGTVMDMFEGAFREARQEGLQSPFETIAGNIVERDYLDPSKTDITEGWKEASAMGVATGGLLGFAGGAATPTRVDPVEIMKAETVDDALNTFNETLKPTPQPITVTPEVQVKPTNMAEAYDALYGHILNDTASWLSPEAIASFGTGFELTPGEARNIIEKKRAGLALTPNQQAKGEYIDLIANSYFTDQVKREDVTYDIPEEPTLTEGGLLGIDPAVLEQEPVGVGELPDFIPTEEEQPIPRETPQQTFEEWLKEGGVQTQEVVEPEITQPLTDVLDSSLGRKPKEERKGLWEKYIETEDIPFQKKPEVTEKIEVETEIVEPVEKDTENIPKDISDSIARMEQELAASEKSVQVVEGEDARIANETKVTGKTPATTPSWFKNPTIKAYDKANGTEYAKNVSQASVKAVLKKVRAGKELTGIQEEVWEYIQIAARQEPDAGTGVKYDQYEKEGFDFQAPEETSVGSLKEGDEVVVLDKTGVPDKLTHKGRDETGDIVLEDGIKMHVDEFDTIDVVGRKDDIIQQDIDQEADTARVEAVAEPTEAQKEPAKVAKAPEVGKEEKGELRVDRDVEKQQVQEQIAKGEFVPAETLRQYPDIVKPEEVLEKPGVSPVSEAIDETVKSISKELTDVGIENSIAERENEIVLSKIVVPKEVRGKGYGTKSMEKLIKYADEKGKVISLTPSTDFGGKSVAALKRFYKKLGFVENKGKNKDYEISESMYRPADETKAGKYESTLIDQLTKAKESTISPITKELATFLEAVIPGSKLDIKVKIDPEARTPMYNSQTKTITLKDPSRQETSLHEIVHAVTVGEMAANPEIKMRVSELMKTVRKGLIDNNILSAKDIKAIKEAAGSKGFKARFDQDYFGGMRPIAYAMLNENEFLSQAFSSPEFQGVLKSIPVERKGWVNNAWDAFIDMVMKSLGMDTKNHDAFNEVLKLTAELAQVEAKTEVVGEQEALDEEGPVTFAETKEPITQENYDDNFSQNRDIKEKTIRGTAKVGKDIVKGLDKYLGAISTRLANIDPKLKFKLRRHYMDIASITKKYMDSVTPLLEKARKSMNARDASEWDYARKNGDKKKINELIKTHDLQKEYDKYRETLDKIRQEGLDVGYEIGLVDEYAPRILKDAAGFLRAIGKEYDNWPAISRKIQGRAQQLGISESQMTVEMKADMVANMLFGGPMGKAAPGSTKARKLDKIPPELDKYYMSSDAALHSHIHGMVKAIEGRKFFGRVPQNITNAKRGKHSSESRYRKNKKEMKELYRAGDPESRAKAQNIKERNKNILSNIKAYKNILDAFGAQPDFTESISAYVYDLVDKKKIEPDDQQDLIDIFRAAFNPKSMGGLMMAYKNISYIDTMGSFTSAATQIGDQAWSLYDNGLIPTLRNDWKALRGKSRLTKEEAGFDRIAEEFADPGTLSKAVSTVFRAVGLEKMDTIGKETLINGAIEKYEKRAQNDEAALRKELEPMFEHGVDSVIDSLKAKEITEDTKFLGYSKLLDFQPAAPSEMTEKYLTLANGKIFYMLKTFTLKQFDIFRNISYNKIKNGTKAERIEGLQNLFKMSLMFILANAGADEIKDWMTGRKTDLNDRVVDNLLRLFGVSKYITWKARTEGIGSAMGKQILPPFKFADSLYKDVVNAGDGKGLEVLGSVPVVGKLAYWHMGRGTSKREDLWDRRLRLEKAKLNKIKDKVEREPSTIRMYNKQIRRLKRVNALQGKLNKLRSQINKIKALDESRTNKRKIQLLEKRRNEMIKNFLGSK